MSEHPAFEVGFAPAQHGIGVVCGHFSGVNPIGTGNGMVTEIRCTFEPGHGPVTDGVGGVSEHGNAYMRSFWNTTQQPPVDQRPHSRACGIRRHDHGPECHPNCPTCGTDRG